MKPPLLFLLMALGGSTLLAPPVGARPSATTNASLSLRLIVNGQAKGNIAAVRKEGQVMIPLRSVVETLGWTVGYEQDDTSSRGTGMSIRKLARAMPPFLEEHAEPAMTRLAGKGRYVLIFEIGEDRGRAFSPSWGTRGEEYDVRPVPLVIDGRIYVPLKALEEMMADRFGEIGQKAQNREGNPVIVQRGVKFSLVGEASELRITYLPPLGSASGAGNDVAP